MGVDVGGGTGGREEEWGWMWWGRGVWGGG